MRPRPAILRDHGLFAEKLAAVLCGDLLAYQDQELTFVGDPEGGHKVVVYCGGIEMLRIEITAEGVLVLNGEPVPKDASLDKKGIIEPFLQRLEQIFGRPVNRDD